MLYIQSDEKVLEEGKHVHGLKYCCRNCDYKEIDSDPKRCVYENIYNQKSSTYDIIYNKYTRHDPTLPRMNTIKCINEKCISNMENLEQVLILTDLSIHDGIRNIRNDISAIVSQIPGASLMNLDEETAVVVCPNEVFKARMLLAQIHSFVEYHKKIEPQVIFIKYDPEALKYVYICDYCNTSWKK